MRWTRKLIDQRARGRCECRWECGKAHKCHACSGNTQCGTSNGHGYEHQAWRLCQCNGPGLCKNEAHVIVVCRSCYRRLLVKRKVGQLELLGSEVVR